MWFSSSSHAIRRGSRRGRGYFLYVWVYLSVKTTCKLRHISLCIHRCLNWQVLLYIKQGIKKTPSIPWNQMNYDLGILWLTFENVEIPRPAHCDQTRSQWRHSWTCLTFLNMAHCRFRFNLNIEKLRTRMWWWDIHPAPAPDKWLVKLATDSISSWVLLHIVAGSHSWRNIQE